MNEPRTSSWIGPKTKRRLTAIAGGALAFTLASCSAGEANSTDDATSVTNLAFVDDMGSQATTSTTLIAEAPDVRLSETDNELVRFESTWICEVQRRTFQTQTGRDEALVDKLAEFGLTEDAYREFRTRVNSDRDLRDSILYSYQETCRP